MKVSYKWLKELAPGLPAADELVVKIGAQLGGVDEIIDQSAKYPGAVVAEVEEAAPLEGSDHLSLCFIDDNAAVQNVARRDDGLVQVLCGAPNVRAGLKVVWLPPGATVPSTYGRADEFVLGTRKMLGQDSNGMLASPRELSLSDEHDGILELANDASVGRPFAEVYGLDDQIIDIENKMFTHRPDCFGLLGVARECAGITGQEFNSPEWYQEDKAPAAGQGLPLKFINELPQLCPRFMLLPMDNIKVGPSPAWLQARLSASGMRPINNVVDTSNYIMLLTGQPTHAYDYDKVAKLASGGEPEISARSPHDGEKLTLLSGKVVQPPADSILIATPEEAIGLAGVMGGGNTEVDDTTTRIILEVASFDMYSIRRTSMAVGVFSDAATRFTKGQSPRQNGAVMAEFARLLGEVAGAQPAGALIDDRHLPAPLAPVTVNRQFVAGRLGLDESAQDMAQLLQNVEFQVDISGDAITVTPPFWRTDIELREDVVEEIGRLYGYDNLPQQLPQRGMAPAAKNASLELKQTIRERLARAGANEVLGYSFVHGNLLNKVGQAPARAFKLDNALSPDLQHFRLSLMPSLLEKIHPNIKAGRQKFALFETGKGHIIGQNDDAGLPREDDLTALVITADDKLKTPGAAYHAAQKYAEFLLPGASLSYQAIPSEASEYDITKPYDPARSSFIYSGQTFLGIVGEFRQAVKTALKLPKYTAGFELDTQALKPFITAENYHALPRFPYAEQDICMKVPATTSFAAVNDFVHEQLTAAKPDDSHLLINLLDIYQRPDDTSHKQITFGVKLASYQKTLRAEELTKLMDQLTASAQTKLNAERV